TGLFIPRRGHNMLDNLIGGPPFWQLAHSSADNFPALTVSHFITANLLPVMLGNIIGGAVLVSMCYRAIYLRQEP
ncbi:formate/nitrite transporter family protein, partial [Shigella boydii]|uniref:formate/nitrite transporter family protein n=1 Tax=Shigella boydii TaxID=621 RepID=UPI003BA9D8D5